MNRYALLGTYDTRGNVEVVAFSDNLKHLRSIRKSIANLNHEFQDRDRDEVTDKAKHIMDTYLDGIDIYDEYTGYVHEINVIGIIEIRYI